MKSFIYLLLALFFYSDVYAQDQDLTPILGSGSTDYYWSGQFGGQKYASPFNACSVLTSGEWTSRTSRISDTRYQCSQVNSVNGAAGGGFTTNRFGSTCPLNSSYNTTVGGCVSSCATGTTRNAITGECVANEVPNPCSSKSGQSGGFTKTGTVGDSFLTVIDGSAHYPSEAQVGGCAGVISDVKCNVGSGPDAVYACKGTINYDGQKAPEGTTDNSTETEDTSIADPASNSSSDQNCDNFVTAADGSQSRTCTTSSESSKEGQVNCGTFNGQFMCIGPSPTPEKDSVVKTDHIKQETLSNGNTKTTTTSTVNNTYCSGTVCSTTTTTTTTSVTKSGDTVVSTVTNCTGPNCPKPTDSTGSGGGGGGKENGGAFAGGGGCVESAGCSPDTDFLGEAGDEIPSIAETNQRIFESFETSGIGQALNNITWPTGGSCPTYSLSVFDSSITVNQHCEMWSQIEGALSAVFLAIWALAAVRIFMSA